MLQRFVYLSVLLLTISGCAVPEAATGRPADSPADAGPSWRGWGGPNGDFRVEADGLASSWPTEGPPVVWRRSLGPGYSAIAYDAGTLYTMYRADGDDVVLAADAATGETRWEHRYPAPTSEGNLLQFGEGPHATPLVLDDRVITLGYTGALRCLKRTDGELLWSHDLIADLGGPVLSFGYSASPIEHRGRVIVLVGGERHGAVALDPADGSIVWSGKPSSLSYATPSIVEVGGAEQLVYFSADELIALDPADGGFLWSHPVVNQYRNNCTPVQWDGESLLWVATQLDGGTRALRLTPDGEGTRVEEVWNSNKMSIHYWNTVLLDGHVYASVGSNGGVLAGIELETGTFKWRERGFEKVNFLHAGDRTILLDAEGQLALARLSPDGLELLSQVTILDGPTWTVPTLVGTRLYLRDKQVMLALDLSAAGATEE